MQKEVECGKNNLVGKKKLGKNIRNQIISKIINNSISKFFSQIKGCQLQEMVDDLKSINEYIFLIRSVSI